MLNESALPEEPGVGRKGSHGESIDHEEFWGLIRHPRELGSIAIGTSLTHLAMHEGVSPATQNQALNAPVFLYR
jgi:hypothetical protein